MISTLYLVISAKNPTKISMTSGAAQEVHFLRAFFRRSEETSETSVQVHFHHLSSFSLFFQLQGKTVDLAIQAVASWHSQGIQALQATLRIFFRVNLVEGKSWGLPWHTTI
jgi:hypothetical protein